jgi:hypothetical protein
MNSNAILVPVDATSDCIYLSKDSTSNTDLSVECNYLNFHLSNFIVEITEDGFDSNLALTYSNG